MKLLADILTGTTLLEQRGPANPSLNGLAIDSRQVQDGYLFAAVRGTQQDGHAYITQAIASGASAVLCETLPAGLPDSITFLRVANVAHAIAVMAHEFYDRPSHSVIVVGVTGTNGKTTIATLMFRLFRGLGYRCGLLSTVQNQIDETILPATHTTPDAIAVSRLMADMVEAGCTHVFMECSSHAIHQHRIDGIRFAGGVFSNITHDHLDYHKTFDEYIRVKKSFFDHLPASAFAITNIDDKRGSVMLQNTAAKKMTYSLRSMADVKGRILDNSLTGLLMEVNGQEVHFRLIGEFNAYNLLAVYAVAMALEEDNDAVLSAMSNLTGAEGRFDYVVSNRDKLIGIVDYAHTPDALENVLATIRKLRRADEQVHTVVGCGGDRDKTKRPLMAAVACEYSHRAILTSDNPRTEDPLQILEDMQQGLKSEYRRRCLVIPDRREAIRKATEDALPGDIILVAGKGHEKYQEIQGVKYHFDDKEELLKCFENR